MPSASPVLRATRPPRLSPHPLHAVLLAFPVALFPGALLSDIAYVQTSQIQWTNFSAWLITGALVFGGFTLLWSAIGTIVSRGALRRRKGVSLLLLALAWIAGLFNAFQHSHDGWSSVGTLGLALSVLSTLFVLAAGLVFFSQSRTAAVEAAR
ncbi:DUF2231 domain-containing protein [Novosphingobium lindaniclasticum]|uniref:DUF2231 domain-containing protein n=1 Tax=Novosphingobium lindaniclasticum TaxID=1329895 RepID=UPI0024091C38|nr:DUF2231 domain-containing protein [Novosphingobium lindaniclasticum]